MTGTAPLCVAVFVGTRADLGPLSTVLTALHTAPDIDLKVLTGLGYAADDLAAALPAEVDAASWRASIRALVPPLGEMSASAAVDHGAQLAAGTATALRELGSQVLVVLGDRWELLYVVPAAFLLGIPIVHLHGGEVTEGAVDERVRHAVSKLADQHCVASSDAAQRLLRMGEPPERVHHTGAPGLDRIVGADPASDEELAALLDVEVERPLALFTYHPPTAQADAPVGQWAREALEATREACGTVVATYPGFDVGREQIIEALHEIAASSGAGTPTNKARVVVVEALGRNYPRVLAAADVVVGNSSSGLIEAAAVGVPSVDVGERQRGRLRGGSVIHAEEGHDAVAHALAGALSPQHRALAARRESPYGTGEASGRILAVVQAAPAASRVKPFTEPETLPVQGGSR